MQPGVVPQPRQELDPGLAVLGGDQWPDHAPQGIAAVDDAEVKPAEDPGLLPEQFDRQLALGPERLFRPGGPGPGGQLGLAEVEPPGDRQEPGGLIRVVEQGPEDPPVVGPDGGGPVRASGRVLVEGAGAPDVLARAVHLGVIDGVDVVAMPDPPRGRLDQAGQVAGDGDGVPPPVLDEPLHRPPVGHPLDGDNRLGDGVFLNVQGQGGDPLDEPAVSGACEAPAKGCSSRSQRDQRSVTCGMGHLLMRGQMGS